MRIQSKPVKVVLAFVWMMALVLAAGCGNVNNNGVKSQSYSDDGYLGTTNSYPRIPGRNMALNYSNDAKMMRQSIRDVRGVAGANITFNGPEAYVTLKLDPGLNARSIPTVERQAASVLRFNFPRYTVHVRSMR